MYGVFADAMDDKVPVVIFFLNEHVRGGFNFVRNDAAYLINENDTTATMQFIDLVNTLVPISLVRITILSSHSVLLMLKQQTKATVFHLFLYKASLEEISDASAQR